MSRLRTKVRNIQGLQSPHGTRAKHDGNLQGYAIGLDSCMDSNRRLLLDIDSVRCPQFRRLTRELRRAGLIPAALCYKRSGSGKKWHVIIELRRTLPDAYRVALQAALGSDRWRELCNIRSILFPPKPKPKRWKWNVLYQEKIRV